MSNSERRFWSEKEDKFIKSPNVSAFLTELLEVCHKHGIGISHQDGQGSFIFEKTSPDLDEWISSASLGLSL